MSWPRYLWKFAKLRNEKLYSYFVCNENKMGYLFVNS